MSSISASTSGQSALGATTGKNFLVTSAGSPASNPQVITGFSLANGDTITLKSSVINPRPLAWFGQKNFVFDGTFGNSGVQFPLAGDGLSDAIWDYDAVNNRTRIAVDIDDDGVFGSGDLLVYIAGQHELSFSDFVQSFAVVRGGAGADIMPGTSDKDA